MVDNCISVTKVLLDKLKVKYTKEYLTDNILSHADHPSLLAISDTLNKYNIENLTVRVDAAKLEQLPLPGIVQVSKEKDKLFYTLNSISEKEVVYYDDRSKLFRVPKTDFYEIWQGVCLLAESSAKSGEVGIEKKLASKKFLNLLTISLAVFFIAWIVLSFLKTDLIGSPTLTVYTIAYTILKIIGLTVGTMLLWFEVDQYNPTLQSFCTSGKKVNCNSVLNSKQAKLFNGAISFSHIGFSYFFGSFLFLVITGFAMSSFSILAFLSFTSLPIVVLSLYYQAVVIKQWCKFCIIIQMVLVTELFIAFFGDFYKASIDLENLPLLLLLMIVPIVLWKHIKPLLDKEKMANLNRRGLKKIKNNPDVLKSLLDKSREITNNPESLGLSLTGGGGAKYNVIKVCNPYCGPCAKAHPILEELVNQGRINLRIIFTASLDSGGRALEPVRHFLALDDKYNGQIKEVLDEWYGSDQKDYTAFANKYPMNGELTKQDGKIEDMSAWCKAEKITHTPTLFIDGRELPNEYTVEDLRDVLG